MERKKTELKINRKLLQRKKFPLTEEVVAEEEHN